MVLEDMEGNENVINRTGGKTAFEKEAEWNWRELRLDGNVLKESGVVWGEEVSREFTDALITSLSEIK